jgi:long-chain acyl-CoA synthetase
MALPASVPAPASVVSLVDVLEGSAAAHGARDLFGTKRDGAWTYTTYAQFSAIVDRLRGGLASLGVGRGDKVAIIANNRLEWAAASYATSGLGAAFVPMYEHQLEREWEYIVRDSHAKVLFVSSADILDKLKDLPTRVPTLRHVVAIDAPAPVTYQTLLERGASSPVAPVHPGRDDLAALLYTAGTTGNPKGVMLSHGNIVSNITAVQSNLPISRESRSLAFLPWAHAFGHTAELHLMLSIGASMAICDTTDKLLAYLGEVQPTVLFAVPRVFNRLYAAVEQQMTTKPAIIRNLFRGGLRASLKKGKGESLGLGERFTLALAEKLVFSKVRARFGGKLVTAVSGAAALSREVAEFVDGLGIAVYEGYGLTETSPIVAVNVPGHRKIGSVGQTIPGCRVEIDKVATGDAQHGEIVVHGPNVMRGYHGLGDETKRAFTSDGGFRTGDMGYLDQDGFLFITGRIKEQYKLENGKYIVPAPLEEQLKLSPLVANVLVFGDNKPFNVALVVPNLEAVRKWAASQGLKLETNQQLLEAAAVKKKLHEELDRLSTGWKGYERIKDLALIDEDFTQENDMLTPKMSVKRRNVLKKWGAKLDALYPR